jgi:hypothetical protein
MSAPNVNRSAGSRSVQHVIFLTLSLLLAAAPHLFAQSLTYTNRDGSPNYRGGPNNPNFAHGPNSPNPNLRRGPNNPNLGHGPNNPNLRRGLNNSGLAHGDNIRNLGRGPNNAMLGRGPNTMIPRLPVNGTPGRRGPRQLPVGRPGNPGLHPGGAQPGKPVYGIQTSGGGFGAPGFHGGTRPAAGAATGRRFQAGDGGYNGSNGSNGRRRFGSSDPNAGKQSPPHP